MYVCIYCFYYYFVFVCLFSHNLRNIILLHIRLTVPSSLITASDFRNTRVRACRCVRVFQIAITTELKFSRFEAPQSHWILLTVWN